jgi:dimethylargininase
MMILRAIVRPPGRRYASALTQRTPPEPVDLARALAQHRAYVAALEGSGVEVIELAADHEHADSVFVQDPVLVVDGRAIALLSAVESRRGEAAALVAALEPHVPVASLRPPATLDGGDVLITDRALFVGISTRSNEEGCRQLADLTGRPVERVPLPRGMLHLLSGCTWLGRNRLLATVPLAAAFPRFHAVIVPEDEAPAANVLVLGRHAIVPEGYPGVAALLEAQGFALHVVPCSEFEKRDGGVTCRALVF